MHKNTRKSAIQKFAAYLLLVATVTVMAIPVYWIIVTASLPEEVYLEGGLHLLPGGHFIQNFIKLENNIDFVKSIWHSVLVAVVYTVLSLFLCSMGGFAFAKYEFRYKKPLFYFILAIQVLPIQILVIPYFLMVSKLNLANTFTAIILPYAAHPLGIFLMRQNMRKIPDSLLESARMDGATEFQLFYRIGLPTMKSSVAALGIILFLFQWNLFLFPLVILREGKYTIPLAISQLVRVGRVQVDQIMVAASLALIPLFLVFIVLQKYFVQGILAGSVKE